MFMKIFLRVPSSRMLKLFSKIMKFEQMMLKYREAHN